MSLTTDSPASKIPDDSAQAPQDLRLDGSQRALFDELGRAFSRRAEERYVRRLSAEQLRRSLADTLGFIIDRAPGEVKVRAVPLYELGQDPNQDLIAIETCMDDQAFIVDTLKIAFAAAQHPIAYATNLLLHAERDANGRLVSLREDGDGPVESITRFVLLRGRDPEQRRRLVSDLQARFELLRAAVGTFPRLKKLAREVVNDYDYLGQIAPRRRDAFDEASRFLEWLVEEHFVFFGASFYAKQQAADLPLGAGGRFVDLAASPPPGCERALAFFQKPPSEPELVRVRKSDRPSQIHRTGQITDVLIRRFDEAGQPAGGIVLHGLLTQTGTTAPGRTIPIVRRRLDRILREEEAMPESHHERALKKAFDSLPAEFLLEAPETGLRDLVLSAVRAESSREAAVHVSANADDQVLYALVIVAQDMFTDSLREALQATLVDSARAGYSEYRVSVSFGGAISIYFYLSGCATSNLVPEDLRAELLALCTPWLEQLGRTLRAVYPAEVAQRFQDTFGSAFPESYQRTTSPDRAVRDMDLLSKAQESGETRFDFFQEGDEQAGKEVRLRLYQARELFLSDILPVLDHFGFRVLDQEGITLELEDNVRMSMDTFRLAGEDDAYLLLEHKDSLSDGLRAAFRNDFQSDPLNQLMVRPGLHWQEVDALRAYLGYLLQIRPTFAREALQRVLCLRPEVSRALIDFFHARFDPALPGDRAAKSEAAKRALWDRLRVIQDATEDRVLRAFANVIEATIRTNYYRARQSHYLSFKFECAKLETVPEPRPLYEVFVHAATVEGVHLRGGNIARGGIRWSDRVDDYRTEVFGLMRTQMVKNVVIVPTGAKGGFILKHEKLGLDRRAAADKMYETFIRGLLDVTDNIVGGSPQPPPNVVTHDAPDPYLVVAADKGTAHLSDTANRIAREYGFWLDDAFASGGSAGYDHKIYAITARGAWACAKHHFSFLGIDPERDPIKVVGIGDMSGDVFGNGMLLSKTLRVVGAFDHRHIFLDPSPDPEISFQERQRLFRLPRSSWADYKREALSKGGGTFVRSEKEIVLSPECQALLGVEVSTLPPETVIELLTLDVDMIWNGGIGTFIKASTEEHVAVGDRLNDILRVDAKDVRAKVIAEGGNLGVTQRGRVEYARAGGRINTDAIDNSGGVDLSDHEVNLKILLTPLVKAGQLTIEERDKLLRDIADEVCAKVIANNDANAISLTLEELRSKRDPHAFVRAVMFLDQRGVGIPRQEQVPSERELQERGRQLGLFRPELAKISAYMKMYVSGEILRSDPQRFPDSEKLLVEYFPEAVMTRRFRTGIDRHLLIKELLSTVRTNNLLEFADATFFPDLMAETDRSVADVALAYVIAIRGLGAEALRAQILGASDVKADARYNALILVEEGLREATSWLLHFLQGDLLRKRGAVLDMSAECPTALTALRQHLPGSAPNAWKRVQDDAQKLSSTGLPAALAQEVAITNQWAKGFPVAELAQRTSRSVDDVAQVYLALGQQTRLNALILRIGRQPAGNVWEALAMRSLRASLLRILFDFGQKLLVARATVERVLEANPAFLSIAQDINRVQPNAEAPVDVSMLVVLAEKLRTSLERVELG